MKARRILLPLLISLFLLCSLFFLIPTLTVSAEEITTEYDLENEYDFGETIEIPKGSIDVGGTVYSVEPIVYFPDGSGCKTDTLTINQRGIYTVDYLIKVNGKTYHKSFDFSVKTELLSFTNKNSSYYFGEISKYNPLENWNAASNVVKGLTGLNVTLAKNDTISFNRVIDLSNLSNKTSLIDFYLVPNELGVGDVKNLYITFTDAFDKNNSFSVYYKLSRTDGYDYVVAKANNQPYTGLEAKYSGGEFAGYTYRINDSYGSVIYLTPGGVVSRQALQKVSLCYSLKENALYNSSFAFNALIDDFDDPAYQSDIWSGFSSNYVFMSITAEDYAGDNMGLFITNVCGCDLSDLSAEDTEAPEISIDNNVDLFNLPNGGVGLNYKVFNATAKDLYSYGEINVSRRVFYKYARENGTYYSKSNDYAYEVAVIDDCFTPKSKGKYSIVYSAIDYEGNYVEIVSNVNILKDFVNETYLNLANAVESAELGNKVNLAEILNFGGYSGYPEIQYKVMLNGDEIELFGNDITGYYFVPEKAGDYIVSVILTDTVGASCVKEYTVIVSEATTPSISGEVILPKYFIKEFAYEIPTLYAVDYNNNKKLVATSVKIIDGAGTRNFNGGKASFVPDNDGFTTIRYEIGANFREYKVPVISGYSNGDIALQNYFYLLDGKVEVINGVSGVEITSRNTSGLVEFINPLLAEKLAVDLTVNTKKNDFYAIDILLTDSVNSLEAVAVSLVKEAGQTSVFINGIDTGFDFADIFNDGSKITFSYNASKKAITDGASSTVSINETIYGIPFNGFSSGKIYVAFGMEGVNSRSSFYVQKINNQNLNANIYEDKVKPEYLLNGKYDTFVIAPNEKFTVFSAKYDDVLSPIASATVSVLYNDNYITDVDGKILNNVSCDNQYELVLRFYGEYIITYSIKDVGGRLQGYSYKILVVDKEAPQIKTSMKNKTVKLGSVVGVSSAKAVDNFDGKVEVYIYVICPDFSVKALGDSRSFGVDIVGNYIVRYIATDAEGNTATLDFTVKVEVGE